MDRMLALYPHFAYRTNKWTVRVILHCIMLVAENIWFEIGKSMRMFDHTILLTEEIMVQAKNLKIVAELSGKMLCESIPYLCHHNGYPLGISQFTVETKMPADVVIWTLKKDHLEGNPVGCARNAMLPCAWLSGTTVSNFPSNFVIFQWIQDIWN